MGLSTEEGVRGDRRGGCPRDGPAANFGYAHPPHTTNVLHDWAADASPAPRQVHESPAEAVRGSARDHRQPGDRRLLQVASLRLRAGEDARSRPLCSPLGKGPPRRRILLATQETATGYQQTLLHAPDEHRQELAAVGRLERLVRGALEGLLHAVYEVALRRFR